MILFVPSVTFHIFCDQNLENTLECYKFTASSNEKGKKSSNLMEGLFTVHGRDNAKNVCDVIEAHFERRFIPLKLINDNDPRCFFYYLKSFILIVYGSKYAWMCGSINQSIQNKRWQAHYTQMAHFKINKSLMIALWLNHPHYPEIKSTFWGKCLKKGV